MTDALSANAAMGVLGAGVCVPDEALASELQLDDCELDVSILPPMVRRRTSLVTRIAVSAASRACAVAGADLQMPAMQGRDFLRKLKLIDGRPEAIVITGQLQPEVGPHDDELPPVDLLLKPFDRQTLLQAVARALADRSD